MSTPAPTPTADGRLRDLRLRRHHHRRRRLRPARRHRGPGARPAHRAGLQVAARQGAHRHGRRWHGGRHGQRVERGQLAGPLPRHHARRQDAQQLAHGADPRPGGPRPGLRARALGRAVRPHPRRAHHPARLRWPPLRPPGPRGRPHRAGADPHAAAEGRLHGHRRLHGDQDPAPAARRRRPHFRRRGLPAPDRRNGAVHRQGVRPRHRLHRQVVEVHVELVGVRR